MSTCTSPHLVRRTPEGLIKFLNRDVWTIAQAEHYFGKENIFLIPCGKCSACVLSKRKEYMIRAAMEAKYHSSSCFLTLTYDENHCPSRLLKRDLQLFIKAIRNKGHKIRYFGCGEYGSMNGRPHYHLIVFGYKPSDMKLYSQSSSDCSIFSSDEISSLWKKGMITVQEFTPACAGYVAGYVNKKIDNRDGFLMMSKKPGLGYQYLVDHGKDFEDYDKVNDDFGKIKEVRSPRYFDRIADRLGFNIEKNKLKRMEASELATAGECLIFSSSREQLLINKKYFDDLKLSKLRRNL